VPNHRLKMAECCCAAQVGKVGFQASQTVRDENRIGWGVGVEPADTAEDIEARSHWIDSASDGAWPTVTGTLISGGLLTSSCEFSNGKPTASCSSTCNVLLNSISDIPSRTAESSSRTVCGYTSLRAEKSPQQPLRATVSSVSCVTWVTEAANAKAMALFVSDATGLTI
jgi:hypothetical protein